MQKSDYKSLEQDVKFKRAYLSKIPWWKNILLVSPTLLLFVGIAGIVHFSSSDMLFSWRSSPYIGIFVLGALWLRYVKNHLQKSFLKRHKSFLCCIAVQIGEKEGYYYYLFSKGEQRYNKHQAEKTASAISFEQLPEQILSDAKKRSIPIAESNTDDVRLYAIAKNTIMKEYKKSDKHTIIPLVYVADKHIFPINQKFIK